MQTKVLITIEIEGRGGHAARPHISVDTVLVGAQIINQIQSIVDRLVKEANAQVVFIIDKNGQLIAAAGETEQIDTT